MLLLCVLLTGLVHVSQCANKVIFISFDGFRYDYLDMAEEQDRNISAFKALREAGFQAEVQNVMSTLTFPSHFAMATGRYVENHGLVGNNFYDPIKNQFYSYTNNYRNAESDWFEYGDSEPLWATNERHGGRSCVFQWVGSEARIHGKMAFATAGVYNSNYPLRWRVDRIIDWISRDEFTLAMLYHNEPDSSGHSYGPNSTQVMDAVEMTNDGLAYLLQRIDETPSLKGKVNIIVSSDHGMAYADCNQPTLSVKDIISELNVRYDVSPATVGLWPRNTTNVTAEQVLERLKNISHMTAYLKEDIPDRYHYKNNYRIAPVVGFADQGYLIDSRGTPYTNLCKLLVFPNL